MTSDSCTVDLPIILVQIRFLMYLRTFLEICSSEVPLAGYELVSDNVAQRLQILLKKKSYFIIKPHGNRKRLLEPQLATLCVLSLYTLYVSGMLRHGG